MKKYYSISIPKPCHENWNTMTPKEKGRFCNSCAKTVIDFTKMDSFEVQNFIRENKTRNICGHFKQTQLDSINIYIPSQILKKQQCFHKIFLLTLLIVMGTTLMNCINKNGTKQKIDSIEVVDSINKKTIDKFDGTKEDILPKTVYSTICPIPKKPSIPEADKELVIKTVGNIEIIRPTGIIEYEEEEELVIGMLVAESPPEFKNTPKNLTIQEKRKYLSKQITEIISKNFNTSVCLKLKGKQKIFTQFKINEKGLVIDIKIRAPHPKLETEAKRVIMLLPQFIPAKQRNKPTKVVYTLPIIFQAEE